MSKITYRNDLRDQDGETTSAEALKENFSDLEVASSEMDWRNVDPWSLDQFHVARGQSFKRILGSHTIDARQSGGWGGNSAKTVAEHSFEARTGSGVYIIVSGSMDGQATTHAHGNATGSVSAKHKLVISSPAGWRSFEGHNTEVHGGLGGVFAYQVQDFHPSTHVVKVRWSLPGPVESFPARVNLVIFVVDR